MFLEQEMPSRLPGQPLRLQASGEGFREAKLISTAKAQCRTPSHARAHPDTGLPKPRCLHASPLGLDAAVTTPASSGPARCPFPIPAGAKPTPTAHRHTLMASLRQPWSGLETPAHPVHTKAWDTLVLSR